MSETEQSTAQIIRFPAQRTTPAGRTAPPPQTTPAPLGATAGQPDNGQERLQRALTMLNAAMLEQRTAVAAWRVALSDLKTAMTGLNYSVQRYRGSLDTLGERVAGLQAQAAQLERTAESGMAARPD